MNFIGIDPGQAGGIAVINEHGTTAWKMPSVTVDVWHLLAGLEGDGDVFALIEDVHSGSFHGRQQGVKSAFTFGQNYGHLVMGLIAAGIPFERVTPRKWQEEFGLLKKKHESDTAKKNRHKQRASELFPAFRMTHAIADALLIAEFNRRCRLDSAVKAMGTQP